MEGKIRITAVAEQITSESNQSYTLRIALSFKSFFIDKIFNNLISGYIGKV